MKYKDLLNSDIWKNKKELKLKNTFNKCQKCGSNNNLQLHHSHYEALYGNEKQKSLYILCNNCHNNFHKKYGIKKNMVIETREFLGLNQSYIFLSNELIEYIKKGGKFKQQKFTKSIRTWRKALKYIKNPELYKNEVNFI